MSPQSRSLSILKDLLSLKKRFNIENFELLNSTNLYLSALKNTFLVTDGLSNSISECLKHFKSKTHLLLLDQLTRVEFWSLNYFFTLSLLFMQFSFLLLSFFTPMCLIELLPCGGQTNKDKDKDKRSICRLRPADPPAGFIRVLFNLLGGRTGLDWTRQDGHSKLTRISVRSLDFWAGSKTLSKILCDLCFVLFVNLSRLS